MTEIHHEIKISAPQEKVYEAVSQLKGLRAWYAAQMEGSPPQGSFTFKATGKPRFHWQVVENSPKKIVWKCLEGPGDAAKTQVVYQFSQTADGRTLVEFSHVDWPGAKGNYRKCNTIWGILLHHLKKYVETQKVEPVFN